MKSEMTVNESLKKALKGTAVAFAGMLIYMFLEFIIRVIIARNATRSEYGVFSIGSVLLNFFVIASCLGLHVGATRYIAYYRGKEDYGKVRGIIFSAAQLSFIASLICFLIFFFSSDLLASLFHLEQNAVLKIFAVAVPFAVIIEILASFFRGFDRVQEKVYFRDVLMNILKLLFIVSVIILGYSFVELVYAYVLSIVVASLIFTVYTVKKLPVRGYRKPVSKELLLFSLPLFVTNVIGMIILQMDTLMLGYFKTTAIVGLYNTAHPLAQLIQVFLLSLVFIYIPITSQLYSRGLIDEMRRNYKILTKWIFSITFPLFLIIFLFPGAVLNFLFGPSYAQADTALALRILAIGMFIHVFLGPNAATLIVIGRTKLNLIDNMIGAITNVLLNVFLIPMIGIVGAAIASAISLTVINVLKSAQIFHSHKIHPFTANYLKPVVTSTVLVSIVYVLVTWSHAITFWMLIALCFLFFLIYGLSMLITKSFDDEDMMMLLELERMTGTDASWIKGILKRFM